MYGVTRLSDISSTNEFTQRLDTSKPSATSSPPCGKICSYEWDSREEGKYYPLLYKIVNCSHALHRVAYNPNPVIRPPLRRPPRDLLQNYTMDGKCPLNSFRYFDESSPSKKRHFDAAMFRTLLEREKKFNINTYRDKNVLKPALIKYKYIIEGKRVAVIGTIKPWAEAMLVNLGASSVTTIEYGELIIDHERVSTITPYRIAEQFITGQVFPYDTVFTYSSLEHSGLGRYGDPITPFGDLEASAQVWCMVQPGGHFILAVPVSNDRNNCSVVWNAHRIYGIVRLQHLTANWRVLDEFHTRDVQKHRIYVLQKVSV